MICDGTKKSMFISTLSVIILLIVSGFTFTGSIYAESIKNGLELNFINPLTSPTITAKFGNGIDPITKQKYFHNGIDLAKKTGSPVMASLNGIVIKVEENIKNETGYGRYIIISHNDGYSTIYTKLSKIVVKEGQSLKTGDIIGFVGSTGRSTGPHLHFEIRKNENPINPEDLINFLK